MAAITDLNLSNMRVDLRKSHPRTTTSKLKERSTVVLTATLRRLNFEVPRH